MDLIKNSYLLYRGKSLWDGEEIAAVITGLTDPSSNRKTGVMLQSWIFSTKSIPTDAIKDGSDESVCGLCPLRGKTCYVNLVGINNIYNKLNDLAFVNERILQYISSSRIGLRIGSYGDPAVIPFDVWKPLIKSSLFSVGYTHQWKWADVRWKKFLQASVESEKEKDEANALGWGTFRIKLPDEKTLPGEIVCRNQVDSFIKCNTCKLCNGRKNVNVNVHGPHFKINNFKKLQNAN